MGRTHRVIFAVLMAGVWSFWYQLLAWQSSYVDPIKFFEDISLCTTTTFLVLEERNLDVSSRTSNNLNFVVLRMPIVPRLQPCVPLHQAYKNVSHLGDCKVLPNADPWPTVERDVLPRLRLPVFPTFWREDVCWSKSRRWWRVEISSTLHGESGIENGVSCHCSDFRKTWLRR
jgi:hypothetical protein